MHIYRTRICSIFFSQKRLALFTGESALAETAANSIIENACMLPNNIPKNCGSVTFTMPKMHGLRSAHQSPAITILKNEHMNQNDAVKQMHMNETDETPPHSRSCKTKNMPATAQHGNDMSIRKQRLTMKCWQTKWPCLNQPWKQMKEEQNEPTDEETIQTTARIAIKQSSI